MDEERYSAIERENYLLLDKMSYIMTHPQSFSGKRTKEPRSLNKEARKRELTRITEENRNILKRIQHKEPYYNHLDWEYERKIQEGYLRNICEYPYVLSDAMDQRALQMQRSERSNQPNLAEYLDSKYGVGQPMEPDPQAEDELDTLGPPAPPTRVTKKQPAAAAAKPGKASKKSPTKSDGRQQELEQTVDEMLADQWRSSRPTSAEGGDAPPESAAAPSAEPEAASAEPAAEPAPEGDAEPASEEPASEEPAAEE